MRPAELEKDLETAWKAKKARDGLGACHGTGNIAQVETRIVSGGCGLQFASPETKINQ